MVSEQAGPPTNINQMSTTAIEDNMAFAYQKQDENETDQRSPELPSASIELTVDDVEEALPELPQTGYDQRKATTTSGMSTSSPSELIGRFFNLGEGHSGEKNPTLHNLNLPGSSEQSYKEHIKEAKEMRKQNRRCTSWWSCLSNRLPEIAALNNGQNNEPSEKTTKTSMKQMYERRSSLFTCDKTNSSKNKFFRRFSLNTPSTDKERREMASTSSTMDMHQIIASFREKFHQNESPLCSRANTYSKRRQRQKKCREQNELKTYAGHSQVTCSRSYSFTVPQKSSRHSHKSMKRNPAFASIDQEAAYVGLITRRRKLEQMRRRYMQDIAIRKEMGGFESDPHIPADVEL